jgi:predicted Zn-dependent protease
MPRLLTRIVVACLFVFWGAFAFAVEPEVSKAQTLFVKGSYADAQALLEKTTSPEGKLALSRLYLRVGRYADALKLAEEATKSAKDKLLQDAQVLQGEILFEVGKYAEAEKILASVVKANIENYQAIVWLGFAQKAQGKKKDAEATFYQVFDAFEGKGAYKGKKFPRKDMQATMYLGIAAYQNEAWKSALGKLQLVNESDAENLEGWLYISEMFMAKYATGEAEIGYDEVLKRDPNYPWALVGKARVLMEQSADPIQPKKEIEKALKTNPNYVPALLLQARILMDDEDYDGALQILQKVEKVNPNSLEMMALRGTAYYITGDKKKYEEQKKAALKINPVYAEFFAILSQFAINQHLYEEVTLLCQEGLKIDKDYYPLWAILGQNYIRLAGKDKDGKVFEDKGREALDKAYKQDKFEVKTINILNLYDDVVDLQYVMFDAKPFQFRVHKDDKEILQRVVPGFMKEAYDTYSKKYGITPELVQIEMYTDEQDYATRTVGLPGLGALGVCFGSVITAKSPKLEQFHWGQVLYHELAHTFHIYASKSRVPRWFTEGLAVYETKLAKKEWAREEDRQLKALLDADLIIGVATMNQGFTRAQNLKEILAAYYQSSLMVEYIAENHSFGALVKMLKLFGEGKSTVPALKIATGLDPATFDAGFKAWLVKRFAYLDRDYQAPFSKYRANKVDEYKKAADASPTDVKAQIAAAYGSYNTGDVESAAKYITAALALDKTNADAHYLNAELALALGDVASAKTKFEDAIKAGADGYEVRLTLGQIAMKNKDQVTAKAHFEKAKAFDPTQVPPLQELAKMALANKDANAALGYLKQILSLDQNDVVAATYLIDQARSLKKTNEILEYSPVAIFIAPLRPHLHLWYAEALMTTKKNDDMKKALTSAENALSIKPPSGEVDPSQVLSTSEQALANAIAAEAALGLGDKKRAKEFANAAISLEAGNSRATAVLSKL